MSATMPLKLLSIQEAAEFLGVPVQTLYAWRTTGKGPPVAKVGRHLRYRPETLARWCEQLEGK